MMRINCCATTQPQRHNNNNINYNDDNVREKATDNKTSTK